MVYGIDTIITLYHDKYDILMPPDISQINYNDKSNKLDIIARNWNYRDILEIIASQSETITGEQ